MFTHRMSERSAQKIDNHSRYMNESLFKTKISALGTWDGEIEWKKLFVSTISHEFSTTQLVM